MTAARELPPTSPFTTDDGGPDRAVQAALQAWAAAPATRLAVVSALGRSRVLVPVLAPGRDRSTTAVALSAPDGRAALPVFTQVSSLAAWHADARPVPVPAARAAMAALAEGWELLVVDPAGPVTFVVPGPAVRALAAGTAWEPAVVNGAVRPEIVAAVRHAVAIGDVASVGVRPGDSAEVTVVLGVRSGLGRAALDRLLDAVGRRLAAEPVVANDVDSVEIRVAPVSGVDGGAVPAPA